MHSPSHRVAWLAGFVLAANAISVPFTAVPSTTSTSSHRLNLFSVKDTNDSFGFQNMNDEAADDIYVATVSIGGQPFVVSNYTFLVVNAV